MKPIAFSNSIAIYKQFGLRNKFNNLLANCERKKKVFKGVVYYIIKMKQKIILPISLMLFLLGMNFVLAEAYKFQFVDFETGVPIPNVKVEHNIFYDVEFASDGSMRSYGSRNLETLKADDNGKLSLNLEFDSSSNEYDAITYGGKWASQDYEIRSCPLTSKGFECQDVNGQKQVGDNLVLKLKKTPHYPEYNIPIKKGWNLINIELGRWQECDTCMKPAEFKWGYWYSPFTNEYLLILANGRDWDSINDKEWAGVSESEKTKIRNFMSLIQGNSQMAGEAELSVRTSPMWIYSDKDGNFKIELDDSNEEFTKDLDSGWNFLTIMPSMIDNSLNDLKGNCEITGAYLWDNSQQQWGTIGNLLEDNQILSKEAGVGQGVIIKVANDCKMGVSTDVPNIPQLPN